MEMWKTYTETELKYKFQKINKVVAAKEQLVTAIFLFLQNTTPISAHTLAGASF